MTNQHDHDRGLQHDLRILTRRRMLAVLGGASAMTILACTSEDAENVTIDAPGGGGACVPIPEETAGPYPGDGSNGVNALALAGIVRRDLRTSLAPASGTAEGIALTITLTLVDSADGCAPLAGYAVYLWHCDRDGAYSMYSGTAAAENYLRGVQEADADGRVTFTTTFPGCYAGRWPHVHFEVYPSVASATSAANKLATSQLALPETSCDDVYATAGYGQSVSNLAQLSLSSDNIFSDGVDQQLAAVSGDVAGGFVATLTVAV